MVDKNNLIDGNISVEDAVAASEGASYNFQSDYPNSEIVYVYGEGYKIAVQQGNYTYFMDLPDDFVLSDISNAPSRGSDAKHTDDAEIKAREDNGIREIKSANDYNAGFNSPYVVPVPVGVVELGENTDYQELAKEFSIVLERNKTRVTSTLFNDTEYVGLLTSMLYETDGDVGKAIENLAATDTYGAILKRLGLKQSQIDAERKEFTNPLAWEEDLRRYKSLFTTTSKSQYGVDLPTDVIDVLAELTRDGYFTAEAAIEQINGIVDPNAGVMLDNKILNALQGQKITTTKLKETEVQDLLDKYLPDNLHSTIDIAAEASKFRNNAGYREKFIDNLKKTRYQFYNMYDEDIAWETILAAKQTQAKSILGIDVASDDPLLDEIIKMNDYSKETARLRQYGLDNGLQKTKDDLTLSIMRSFGKGIIPTESFRG